MNRSTIDLPSWSWSSWYNNNNLLVAFPAVCLAIFEGWSVNQGFKYAVSVLTILSVPLSEEVVGGGWSKVFVVCIAAWSLIFSAIVMGLMSNMGILIDVRDYIEGHMEDEEEMWAEDDEERAPLSPIGVHAIAVNPIGSIAAGSMPASPTSPVGVRRVGNTMERELGKLSGSTKAGAINV
jgi:hypothetical protein